MACFSDCWMSFRINCLLVNNVAQSKQRKRQCRENNWIFLKRLLQLKTYDFRFQVSHWVDEKEFLVSDFVALRDCSMGLQLRKWVHFITLGNIIWHFKFQSFFFDLHFCKHFKPLLNFFEIIKATSDFKMSFEFISWKKLQSLFHSKAWWTLQDNDER